MAKGKLIIISAPSGTGKSTIISWLMREHKELNLAYSISCTSRAPRGTEQNGVDYFFLTPEEFRQRIEDDEFLEYEEVYTDRFYGTLKSQVENQLEAGQNVVFDVDVKGGVNINKFYGDRHLACLSSPNLSTNCVNDSKVVLLMPPRLSISVLPVPSSNSRLPISSIRLLSTTCWNMLRLMLWK